MKADLPSLPATFELINLEKLAIVRVSRGLTTEGPFEHEAILDALKAEDRDVGFEPDFNLRTPGFPRLIK